MSNVRLHLLGTGCAFGNGGRFQTCFLLEGAADSLLVDCEGGWISSSAAIWCEGEDPANQIWFPIPTYLIEPDTERILVDTGLHPRSPATREDGTATAPQT